MAGSLAAAKLPGPKMKIALNINLKYEVSWCEGVFN
jgi:hypothetical protein